MSGGGLGAGGSASFYPHTSKEETQVRIGREGGATWAGLVTCRVVHNEKGRWGQRLKVEGRRVFL